MNTSSLNLNDISHSPLESLIDVNLKPSRIRNSSHVAETTKISLLEVLRFDGRLSKHTTSEHNSSFVQNDHIYDNNTIIENDEEYDDTEAPSEKSPAVKVSLYSSSNDTNTPTAKIKPNLGLNELSYSSRESSLIMDLVEEEI